MASISYLVVMATVLLAVVSADGDTSCKDKDWKAKTLEMRAKESKWVAFIHVVSDEMAVMMGDDNSTTVAEVVVNVTCWLKKGGEADDDDGDDAPQTGDAAPAAGDDADDDDDDDQAGDDDRNMTVPDAGKSITIILEKADLCKTHTLMKGKKYVLFMLNNMDGKFNITNVNDESGALAEPRDEDFVALHRGIDSGMSGKPEGECVDGIDLPCFVGDYDKGVCDGAASLVATMATIVAAILAIATL